MELNLEFELNYWLVESYIYTHVYKYMCQWSLIKSPLGPLIRFTLFSFVTGSLQNFPSTGLFEFDFATTVDSVVSLVWFLDLASGGCAKSKHIYRH